jgi:transposase InsO family protein
VNIHKHARLTPAGRWAAVQRRLAGELPEAIGQARHYTGRTLEKWLARYRAEGRAGLEDRSSRPRRLARQLPRHHCRQITKARAKRWSRIAHHFGIPLSTGIMRLRQAGLQRLPALAPPPAVRRYEMARPGDLLHIDIKKLGKIGQVGHRIHGDRRRRSRGIGWEYVHVAIDAYSRVVYAEVLPDERAPTATAFLPRAVAWYAALRVRVRAVMTDNGGMYRATLWEKAVRRLRLRHQRTRPYTPRTNGKVERVIWTLLAEWAYARPYPTSRHRTVWLPRYLQQYNHDRAHSALHYLPPMLHLAQAL